MPLRQSLLACRTLHICIVEVAGFPRHGFGYPAYRAHNEENEPGDTDCQEHHDHHGNTPDGSDEARLRQSCIALSIFPLGIRDGDDPLYDRVMCFVGCSHSGIGRARYGQIAAREGRQECSFRQYPELL
jgi:hypothetical protein